MEVSFTLNGQAETVTVTHTESLLDVLRRSGYTGAKRGCGSGDCGFCTVIIDGDPIKSCLEPAARLDGADVETIENLGSQDDLHPIQAAFVDNAALQCGYCIPGMIMRSKALLADTDDPDDEEIREALSGNICRCTGYEKIVDAVGDAADRVAAEDPAVDGGQADDPATDASARSGGEDG